MPKTDAIDAARTPIANFRQAMFNIHQDLGKQDVTSLKFLCVNVLPVAKLEQCNDGLKLFEMLEDRGLIRPPDDVQFLAELLWHVGRRDLLTFLNYSHECLASIEETRRGHVSPYRCMLLYICQNLTKENLKTLRFLSNVPRSENIASSHELIRYLETQLKITESDLTHLIAYLKHLGLKSIVTRVEQFQGSAQLNSCIIPGSSSQQNSRKHLNFSSNEIIQRVAVASQDLQQAVNHPSTGNSERFPCQEVSGRLVGDLNACHFNSVASSSPSINSASVNYGSANTASINAVPDDDPFPCYSMSSKPRGICIIINNEKFYKDLNDSMSKQLKKRTGTNFDQVNLEKTFRQLDFIVEVASNLTDEQMTSCLRDISMRDHRAYDCFVCCILSHGTSGTVYGSNGRTIPITDLTGHVKAVNCRSLRDKPKIFFIQACQGYDEQLEYPIETDSSSDQACVPGDADFLICLSTVPGHVSYRCPTEGSWYITELTRKLDEFANRNYDLLTILTSVNKAVQTLSGFGHSSTPVRQVPQPSYTLKKRIVFR